MASSGRKCLNSSDLFCYICGQFTIKHQRTNISDFVQKAYHAYFGMKLGDQDKHWAPHIVCKPCVETLRGWTQGKKHKRFGIPMVWRVPQNHHDDCYFCAVNLNGVNLKKKTTVTYPNLPSALQPIPHSDAIPIPVFTSFAETDSEENEDYDCTQKDPEFDASHLTAPPSATSRTDTVRRFNQEELNDLVRDLGLSKEKSELLASRLKERGMLDAKTAVTFYRSREKEFRIYFEQEDSFVYCHDVTGLLHALGVATYQTEDWRMFIDS